MSAAAQNPPETYGMGFALSNVGDGNLTTTMLQSWGGRVADDEGKTCTLDSAETRAFLEWITTALQRWPVPARGDHLGRRRRQHGLSVGQRPVHRQSRQRLSGYERQ